MTRPALASPSRSKVALPENLCDAAQPLPWLAGVRSLKGAGPRTAEILAAYGVETVLDLLLLLPLGFEDKTHLTPLQEQIVGSSVFVEGEVEKVFPRFGARRSWVVRLNANSETLYLRFFQAGRGFKARFAPGVRLRCYGVLREGSLGREIVHPQTIAVTEQAPFEPSLTPVYPRIKGIGQGTLRRLISKALEFCPTDADEQLAPGFPSALGFWQALRLAHGACNAHDLEPARRRLALDELVGLHLDRLRRRQWLGRCEALRMREGVQLIDAFEGALPFQLTAAQRHARDEIFADMSQPHPMHRLLQGDVGSGKTVVAAMAALRCVECGGQAALMAPTDLLAAQHYANLGKWFAPLGVTVALLTANTAAAQRAALLQRTAAGETMVVVGTHALFQDAVNFGRLGLVIVDEQHRFGVAQRMALRAKGAVQGSFPHMLVMSATPIPRTLAMTRYADLDVTTLDQMPAGRKPVVTAAVSSARRAEVAARIADACRRGEQAYWVCPAIEESDRGNRESVAKVAAALRAQLPDLIIEEVHGRMGMEPKSAAMSRFAAGEVQLLVATTVVEVGVDVPSATRIVIENPELLGLAQLHQLRGRVGRGDKEGFCVLLYRPPLTNEARERLAVLRDCQDGFAIAQHDLALRGPGQFDGFKQSGVPPFKAADLLRDGDLFALVPQLAKELLLKHSAQAEHLIQRWGQGSDLSDAA